MDKIERVKKLLEELGLPKRQQSDMCALVILSLANLGKRTPWPEATNEWLGIHGILEFIHDKYQKKYAENTRETIRKDGLHHFVNAALVERYAPSTNSPKYSYRLTEEFLEVIRKINVSRKAFKTFKQNHQSLIEMYASKKEMEKMPVKINGEDFTFSAGKHNQLQKAIIEEFASRFAENSECLYVGDTTQKDLVKKVERLKELGFSISLHDKMPDVVLYRADKDWIYFIEAFTSRGPMDPKRILEISEMTKNVKSGKIFVTAFLDFKTYKNHSQELAWETEVWIAEMPEHMIHLNGDKFLGPRKDNSAK
jgi:hypothetical protein